jgi:uncharacterized CHY-type Zn-finger protein
MMISLILLGFLYHFAGEENSKMPTKYYSNNNKPNPYADAPVSVSTSEDDELEIICPSCRCNTVVKYEDHDHCSRCQHTFNVRREGEVHAADIVESESMDDNPQPLVSYPEDPDARFYKAKKPEYQGAFKSLQDRGIHIISYTQRSGDGSNSSSDSQRRISAPRPFKETKESEE